VTADEIKALAGILHEDARWVGKQYSSPIGDRIEKAVDALEFLSNQLLAKTELANLYAASLRKVEAEVEGLTQENQRLLLEFRADCEKHAEELFAVQVDAERYRWIRQGKPLWVKVPVKDKQVEYFIGAKPERLFPERFDAAIDAARSQIDKEKPC